MFRMCQRLEFDTDIQVGPVELMRSDLLHAVDLGDISVQKSWIILEGDKVLFVFYQ